MPNEANDNEHDMCAASVIVGNIDDACIDKLNAPLELNADGSNGSLWSSQATQTIRLDVIHGHEGK